VTPRRTPSAEPPDASGVIGTALRSPARMAARVAEIRRSLPDVYWIVWIGTLINRMGGFVAPLLTFYLIGERGLSVGAAGLVVSLFGAGQVLAALVGGVLADRLGRRATLLLSMLSGAVCMGSLGLQHSIAAIAVNTFLLGFSGELYRPAVAALVSDVVPPERRLQAFGYLYWIVNLSFAFAAVAGGVLSRWSYTALFAADALTMLAYAAVVARYVPETRPPPRSREPGAASVGLRDVLCDRTFMAFWVL
jgi:MFS family permease